MPFNKVNLIKSILPAYIFPALMAGVSGLLTDNIELFHSSYSYIAVSSFLAAAFCYIVLWKVSLLGNILQNKILRLICLWSVSVILSIVVIHILNMAPKTFDIVLSTSIGSLITVFRQPIKKDHKHENI